MRRCLRWIGLWTVVLLGTASLLGPGAAGAAQFRFNRGQDVSPTFDGWVRNPDGTFSFYFGYLNRNAREEIHIPVGPDNTVEGQGDAGQPTYFYPGPGRVWWVFKVVVPSDWPLQQRLVWTLRHRGHTNEARAWLQAEYELDPLLVSRNSRDGFLFTRVSVADADNRPPTLSGTPRHTVTLPETATLAVTAMDDGRPQDDRGRGGLRFRWILYRGPVGVRFDPETTGPSASPARAETQVTFSAPGDYRLRAFASDGQLFSTHDVDVVVNPDPSGETVD